MIRTAGAHLGLLNGRPGRLPEWPIFLVVFKLRRWSWEVDTGNGGLLCHLPFPPPSCGGSFTHESRLLWPVVWLHSSQSTTRECQQTLTNNLMLERLYTLFL